MTTEPAAEDAYPPAMSDQPEQQRPPAPILTHEQAAQLRAWHDNERAQFYDGQRSWPWDCNAAGEGMECCVDQLLAAQADDARGEQGEGDRVGGMDEQRRYAIRLDFTAASDEQAERLAAAWADTCAAEYGTTYQGLVRLSDGASLHPGQGDVPAS